MQERFWLDRWNSNRIGFHQLNVNSFLQKYFFELGLGDKDEIFVPLCGKSLDMLWLAKKALKVLGVEYSEKAIEEFYFENSLDYDVYHDAEMGHYTGSNISLKRGDFFSFNKTTLTKY